MVDVASLVSHAWFIALLSLIVSLLAFPLVIIGAFSHDYLTKHHPKTPQIVIMLLCTFLAVLIAVTILELYFGYTLGQVFSGS